MRYSKGSSFGKCLNPAKSLYTKGLVTPPPPPPNEIKFVIPNIW